MTVISDTLISKYIVSLFCYTAFFGLSNPLSPVPNNPFHLGKELERHVVPASNRSQGMLVLKRNEAGIMQNVNIYKP